MAKIKAYDSQKEDAASLPLRNPCVCKKFTISKTNIYTRFIFTQYNIPILLSIYPI